MIYILIHIHPTEIIIARHFKMKLFHFFYDKTAMTKLETAIVGIVYKKKYLCQITINKKSLYITLKHSKYCN